MDISDIIHCHPFWPTRDQKISTSADAGDAYGTAVYDDAAVDDDIFL